jgi:hypothetical protein
VGIHFNNHWWLSCFTFLGFKNGIEIITFVMQNISLRPYLFTNPSVLTLLLPQHRLYYVNWLHDQNVLRLARSSVIYRYLHHNSLRILFPLFIFILFPICLKVLGVQIRSFYYHNNCFRWIRQIFIHSFFMINNSAYAFLELRRGWL